MSKLENISELPGLSYKNLDDNFRRHGVPIAYLFGSQKDAGFAYRAGQEHVSPDQRSDLDLGVVFFRFPERPHRAYMDLYADLADAFDPFNLDLVLLQETGFLFQHEAIQGRVLFCDDGEFLDD